MTLIDLLLGRPNGDGQSFENTGEIVKQFLRDVFGEATEAPATAPTPASSSTIVQYDTVGAAIDVAKMILLNQGFQIGKNYYSKGPWSLLPSMPIAWKLISIEGDGSSKL